MDQREHRIHHHYYLEQEKEMMESHMSWVGFYLFHGSAIAVALSILLLIALLFQKLWEVFDDHVWSRVSIWLLERKAAKNEADWKAHQLREVKYDDLRRGEDY